MGADRREDSNIGRLGRVEGITGVKVVSLHHDISTVSGEEVVLFTLAGRPDFRETRKR